MSKELKSLNESLTNNLKYLRLNGLLSHWDEYLAHAASKDLSHIKFLSYILEEECKTKRENARSLRIKKADIPEKFAIETYPFDRQPNLKKKKIMALYDSLSYMKNSENIIWLGRTGCGKTGLATSFLINAINNGYTAKYVLFADLVAEFYRAVADHSEEAVFKRYLTPDCLQIDELGYAEAEPVQVGAFFTLMSKRHKKKTTLITSNLGFQEWNSFLKNDRLTAALIDRLTESSHVFNMTQCVGLRSRLDS